MDVIPKPLPRPSAGLPPLVSVIIPVHNRFVIAHRAIDSVFAQGHRPIQVIISDDASNPPFAFEGESVPQDIAIEVVRSEINRGPGAARELGRLQAKGEYLAFLDSDDYWGSRFLERCVAALQQAKEAGMAYCTSVEMKGDRQMAIRKRSDVAYDSFLPTILWGRPWPTGGCLWRKTLTDRIGSWLPLFWWEDYEYDSRAGALEAKVVHVDEPLCFIQWDAEGMVSRPKEDSTLKRGISSRAAALQAMSRNLARSSSSSDATAQGRMAQLCF